MKPETLKRLSETAPRYTSYPTAPHFHPGVTGDTAGRWMDAIKTGENLSVYVHIPFCDRLCWFCACHTKQTRRYEPVSDFLDALLVEIALVGARVGDQGQVAALHFGGGSPTMLRPEDIRRLMDGLRASFRFAANASISVEIDPNDMDEARLDALSAIGMTRASLGIQDFEPKVQQAINREQSFETTRAVVEGLRMRGVRSVNLDMLYGLPHQTMATIAATTAQVLSLRPDRIALFGYAHVPWFKKHQTMIDEAWLPGPAERLAQATRAAELIGAAGYAQIGLDHFARPTDSLHEAARGGQLARNFQGYTDENLETLIGLGPSSISRYREGYAQNVLSNGEYEALVRAGRLPVAKGIEFSPQDRVRGWVIERLMCDFAFSASEAVSRFGRGADAVLAEASLLAQAAVDPMLEREGDSFVVTDEFRPLVRTVAAAFDAYLTSGKARHSVAV